MLKSELLDLVARLCDAIHMGNKNTQKREAKKPKQKKAK
jgi:hypothetical protein